MRKLLGILLVTAAVVNASKECRFAPQYNSEELRNNGTIRNEFQQKILETEALFMKELGINKETGLTVGKIPLNKKTGMPNIEDIT
jgi:hypothetical protein